MKNIRVLLFCVIFLAISSCGGGGSSDPDINTAPLQITQENARQIAASGSGGVNTVGEQVRANTDDGKEFIDGESTSAAVRSLLRATIGKPPKLLNRVSDSETQSCDSGTLTLKTTDINDNGEIDAGDSIGLKFKKCKNTDEESTVEISGGASVKFNSLTKEPLDVSITANFDDLTVDDGKRKASVDGDISLAAESDNSITSFTVSGSSFNVNDDDEFGLITNFEMQQTWNEISDTWSQTANATVASTDLDGQIVITTPTVLQGAGDANPTTGVMRIEGGGYISLDADTGDVNTVSLTVFDGSTTTTEIIPWADLDDE